MDKGRRKASFNTLDSMWSFLWRINHELVSLLRKLFHGSFNQLVNFHNYLILVVEIEFNKDCTMIVLIEDIIILYIFAKWNVLKVRKGEN